MTLTWVICGAGRRVGKTHLAQKLCQALPDAVYAKQGCSTKKPTKPENFFRTDAELTAFVDSARKAYTHIVVESNELARQGCGDIIIFVDGILGVTDYREDVDLLRSRSHLQINPNASLGDWKEVLRPRLNSVALSDAVCDLLAEQQLYLTDASRALRHVDPLRIFTSDGPAVRDSCDVAVEDLLTIMIDQVGSFAVMCTPCDVKALAIGFAYSEGLISCIEDVVDFSYRPEQQTVGLQLDSPADGALSRNLIVTSSCGLCGSRNIDQLMSGVMTSRDTLRLPAPVLRSVVNEMQASQRLFERTGGTHAAAIFDATGEILAFGEDIGRHNALDKAIGGCLLKGQPLAALGAALSGRVSLELVAKAARAGIELIAAVSAPSSLAVDISERCNITLCGFVRGRRATVYTHPHRIRAIH